MFTKLLTRAAAVVMLASGISLVPVVALAVTLVLPSSAAMAAAHYNQVAQSPPAQVMSVHSTPAKLSAGGGTVVVSSTVRNATSCQLLLLSHQPFRVVYASNVRPCTSAFTAHVVIGRNTSPLPRTVAFALIARGGKSAFTGRFYVALAGRLQTPPTTTPPTTTPPTTTPPTTTPPTTSPSSQALLQAWVDNTLTPDLNEMNADSEEWSNCVEANGGDAYGCESYAAQLEADATVAESDSEAPNPTVQSAWGAYLSDEVTSWTDDADDDFSGAATAANQAVTDLNQLTAAIAAQGITA
jgi:hypothetical protein